VDAQHLRRIANRALALFKSLIADITYFSDYAPIAVIRYHASGMASLAALNMPALSFSANIGLPDPIWVLVRDTLQDAEIMQAPEDAPQH
jgi:hypothetical protein